MCPQITENKLISMFLEVDDLYQAYEKWRLNIPSRSGKKATRHRELHPSEIATIIESVNDILTSICDLEHTRHRSPFNAFANAYAALIAYQFLDHKPHVFISNALII